jgi:hypothetical protein
MIHSICPRYGRKTPIVYVSICSTVGSISVMAIKGFGVAVKLTFGGNNQFTHPSTYVFGIVLIVCCLIQLHYFNKALDIFSTNMSVFPSPCPPSLISSSSCRVNPMYYVGFTTATIVASLILFQGFNTTGGTNTVSLLAGFVVTFLGVHLLNVSRQPESAVLPDSGLIPQRLSFQGWNGVPTTSRSPHSRSHTRSSTGMAFSSFEPRESAGEMVGMHELRNGREEEEEEDGEDVDDVDDVDERTHLHRPESDRERFRQESNGQHSSPHVSPKVE